MKRKIIIECIAASLIVLFISAAISGFLDHRIFRQQLHRINFIGSLAGVISWGLPVTELGVALLLFRPVTRLAGLFCSLFLVSLYTMYFIVLLNFSRNIGVLYAGLIRDLSWGQHIIFNLVFVLLTGVGIVLYGREGNPVHHEQQVG